MMGKKAEKSGCLTDLNLPVKNDARIVNYRFWQEVNDAQQICLNDYSEQKFHYIHQNPVKAEFVNRPEDYRYSSIIDYAGGKGLIDVTLV